MTDDPPSRTEPRQSRSRRTRASLLDAVELLVTREGPEAVTTTRVAAETGLAVGTIYRYFSDREAMLLAAYDATVVRIIERCRMSFDQLGKDVPATDAARQMVRCYLRAAEAEPSHSGLLRAMRAIRPVAADQSASEDRVAQEIFLPFIARFLPGTHTPPILLQLFSATVSTMVDFYLVTEDAGDRARMRAEIEEHVVFMVGRLGADAATG